MKSTLVFFIFFGFAAGFEVPVKSYYYMTPSARAIGTGLLSVVIPDPISSLDNPAILALEKVPSASISFVGNTESLPKSGEFKCVCFQGQNSAVSYLSLVKLNDYDTSYFEVSGGDTSVVMEKARFSSDVFFLQSANLFHISGNAFVSLGLNVKYFYSKLLLARSTTGPASTDIDLVIDDGKGLGIDIGAVVLNGPLKVGVSVKNLLAKIWWDEIEDEVPPRSLMGGIRLDVANVVGIGAGFRGLRSGYSTNFGIEFATDKASLRVGVVRNPGESRNSYTFGLNVTYSKVKCDIGLLKVPGERKLKGAVTFTFVTNQ